MNFRPIYEFGDFRLDPTERLLTQGGTPISLTPKAFDLLVLLVKNSGHLLSKDELMQQIWPDSFVEEINLTQNISVIRKVLGDSTGGQRYVETVPKRGYRFTAPVREAGAVDLASTPGETPAPNKQENQDVHPPRTRYLRTLAAVAGISALVLSILVGARQWHARSSANSPSRLQSLAVLPLVNLSGDIGQDYFADGMTDELTTQLAKVGSIRVISRTSAMRYKNTQKSLQEIARELQVDAVVEGSVIRSDEHVKITTQLIDTSTDRHLWAESYDRERRDAFSVPTQIAQDIAAKINARMTPEERTRFGRIRQVEPAAYEAYFKGRYFWNKRTQADLKKSQSYYQQAIQADPTYAPAYAGLAQCYSSLPRILWPLHKKRFRWPNRCPQKHWNSTTLWHLLTWR